MSIIEDSAKSINVPLKNFGDSEGIIVLLENLDGPTSTDESFLAGFQLPVDLIESELGFTESVDFVYQIDVRYASHRGSAPINRMIDKLRAIFHVNSIHVWNTACMQVGEFNVSGLRVDDGWGVKSISLSLNGTIRQL